MSDNTTTMPAEPAPLGLIGLAGAAPGLGLPDLGWASSAAFDTPHYAHGLIGFLVFSLILTVAATMTNAVLFVVLIGIDFAIFFLVGQLLGGWPSELVGASLLGGSAAA